MIEWGATAVSWCQTARAFMLGGLTHPDRHAAPNAKHGETGHIRTSSFVFKCFNICSLLLGKCSNNCYTEHSEKIIYYQITHIIM